MDTRLTPTKARRDGSHLLGSASQHSGHSKNSSTRLFWLFPVCPQATSFVNELKEGKAKGPVRKTSGTEASLARVVATFLESRQPAGTWYLSEKEVCLLPKLPSPQSIKGCGKVRVKVKSMGFHCSLSPYFPPPRGRGLCPRQL